jgi:hypothetical protein
VARQYLIARMAPSHPAVATLPHAIRSPLNPNSLWTALKHLAGWFNHLSAYYLTDAGVASLTEVTQDHCDTRAVPARDRSSITSRQTTSGRVSCRANARIRSAVQS